MLLFWVFFAAANILESLGQQNPSISFITKEVNASIGDSIDLHCSVHYAANYPVLWVKIDQANQGNNLLLSSSSTQILPDQRYSIRHDETSSTYTLQITKIQEGDQGLYQCQVLIASASKLTEDAWIHVRISPVILDNSTQSVSTVSRATVSLNCYAIGHPEPQISWRRENNDILPNGGAVYRGNILTIHNISKQDRGTYYCLAENGVGKGAQRHVGVEVEFAPVVSVTKTRYGQALGYDVDLRCQVDAYPEPMIVWLKDQHQLYDNQRNHHILTYNSPAGSIETQLRVISVEKEDYGKYICKAINKLGHNQKSIELYGTGKPQCPPACGLSGSSQLFVAKFLEILLIVFPIFNHYCFLSLT